LICSGYINTISGNIANYNSGTGINTNKNSNNLSRNTANNNGEDGINIREDDNIISGNLANITLIMGYI